MLLYKLILDDALLEDFFILTCLIRHLDFWEYTIANEHEA